MRFLHRVGLGKFPDEHFFRVSDLANNSSHMRLVAFDKFDESHFFVTRYTRKRIAVLNWKLQQKITQFSENQWKNFFLDQ